MDAKTFLIQQHKTGKYDDICQRYYDNDYGLPFWTAIVRLMENYSKVALDIPAEEKKCCVCGTDITEIGSNLFCIECGEPNNQICPYCGEDELGFDNGKLRCLCCKKFIN